MRRSLVLMGVLCLVGAAAWGQITVGVDSSTTGAAASLGIPNKNAVLFAPTLIAGQKVRYIFLDDRSDTTTAVQNVKRLITEDNIDVLIGPSITATALAVIDTVAAAKVPVISFASASRIVSPMDDKKKWMFKTVPNDDIYCSIMIKHMVKHHVKTLSMIAVDDSYGESWVDVATKEAEEAGIKIRTVEKFERGDTSATAQALRVMQSNPDAVLIAVAGTPAATPHLALVKLGYKGKIYQSGGSTNADFLRLGGKAVEGAFLPTSPVIVTEQLPDGYPTKAAGMQFLKMYEGKYGPGSRSTYAAHGWDAVKLLEASIPVALKSGAKPGTVGFREALQTAIDHCKDVKAPSAVFNMSPTDHTGINQFGIVLVKIKNGTWKLEDYPKF